MITAYFTKDKKYLQKGSYIKHFEVNTLEELLNQIKVKDEVLIKASAKDIVDFKFKSNKTGNFKFEVLMDFEILDEKLIQKDLKDLYKDIISSVCYRPKDEWQKYLGDKVYLTNSRQTQQHIIQTKDCLAFLPEDLEELKQGLLNNGKIPQSLLVRLFFNAQDVSNKKVVDDIHKRVYNL